MSKLEEEILASGIFEPKVVYGYFPARSDGNDIIVYQPEGEGTTSAVPVSPSEDGALAPAPRELLRFTFPCQREGRKLAIADFFAPKSSGKMDVLGLSLVTVRPKPSVETQRLFEAGEYTRYLYLHGLSVETAEALAEYHHKKCARIGHRRRRFAPRPRPVPPEVSRLALFVWIPSVPKS